MSEPQAQTETQAAAAGNAGNGPGSPGPGGGAAGGAGPPPNRWLLVGKVTAALGLAFLVGVIGHTCWAVAHPQDVPCTKVSPRVSRSDSAVVYSPQTEFTVNGQLCIAWQPAKYFSRELDGKADLGADFKIAKDKELAIGGERDALTLKAPAKEAPERAKYDTDLAAKTTALTDARKKRTDLQAQLDALPKERTIVLFIDDHATPITFDSDVDRPETRADAAEKWAWKLLPLRVPTDAKTEEARTWRSLLSGVSHEGARPVTIGLGDPEAKLPRPGAEMTGMKFRVFRPTRLSIGIGAFLALIVGLAIWGAQTGMLRDGDKTTTFSLARVQMAFWFALTLGGFLFIWLIAGQSTGVLTAGVAALVGISGVTGVAAVVVDATPLPAAPGAAPAPPPPPGPSKGFFADILSDGAEGIMLHRVQMLAWTLVLGGIFASSVFSTYTFPVFDEAMLVLAGLVNGVYVGFKFPEKG